MTSISRSFAFRETLDGLLWVALESCAYEREVGPDRPVLTELRLPPRRRHSSPSELTRSRQQWMAQNSLVYALQAARCRLVLGKEAWALPTPGSGSLFAGSPVRRGPDSPGDQRSRTLQVFRRYLPRSGSSPGPGRSVHGSGQCAIKLRQLPSSQKLPSRLVRTDTLLMTGDRRRGGPGRRRTPGPGCQAPPEPGWHRGRISALYRGLLWQTAPVHGGGAWRLDRGSALSGTPTPDSHLYFTDGQQGALPPPRTPPSRRCAGTPAAQMHRNKAHFQGRYRLYKGQHHPALPADPEAVSWSTPSPSGSAAAPAGLYPLPDLERDCYLHDPRVFMDTLEEAEADFSVDLMLDASASTAAEPGDHRRPGLRHRPKPAAQPHPGTGLLLSQRPGLHGPMQRFVDYDGTGEGCAEQIFRYFAAGWNRDGLALRGAGHLMEGSPAKNRLLIILTDASPNDDRRIPRTRLPEGLSARITPAAPA